MPTRPTFGARTGAAAKAKAKQKGTEILRDWSGLTWFTDSTHVFGLHRTGWNWLLLTIAAACAYFTATTTPLLTVGLVGAGLAVTVGRAMRVMPARRRFVDALIEDTRQLAGHPRSTTAAQVPAASRLKVSRWGAKNRPTVMDMTIAKAAPAAPPLARGLLEKAIDQVPNPHTEAGGGWVHSTNAKTGQLHSEAVPATDERLHQHREIAFLRAKFTDWFKITPKQLAAEHYNLQVTEWTTREHPTDGPVPVPAAIRFAFGSHNVAAQDVRDGIERACDSEYLRSLEWIYTWSDGTLEIVGVAKDSLEAKRKRSARWVADLVAGQAPRNKDAVSSAVTAWQEEVHGDPWVPIAFTADFGSGAFATGSGQRAVENVIDDAMTATAAGLVWVYEWTVGATTSVDARAFPANHIAALRKIELKRLRGVVEAKFGGRRNDADITVTEWEPCDAEAPFAQPARARVTFGSLDVTKVDTRDAFESHFDGLFTTCDWNYDWRPSEGCVDLKSVPPLPDRLAFPREQTPQFDRFCALAREGKILFGPRRRGGEVIWDMTQIPHALIGGQTGAGKSFALGLPLFAVIYQPDHLEAIVCDPKRMDFTWTREFPNVMRFGATDEAILECIEYAAQQMDDRQNLNDRRGVRDLQQLRNLYAKHPEFEAEDGPAPKRLLLFFDEIADYLAKGANKDLEELKDAAKAMLEKLARLARALEINLVTAAQKPGADIISTQLRSQLGFRLCVGQVDPDTSRQIILDNHGTMFGPGAVPKGKFWAYDSKDGYRMGQTMYLPNDDEPCPWDNSVILDGAKNLSRRRLMSLGYQQVMVPNAHGGREPRWVLTDEPMVPPVARVEPVVAEPVEEASVAPVLAPVGAVPAASQDEWDDEW